MKNARKWTSLLLALLLVFALAATAAADGTGTAETPITGTITVENPITNKEYKAYKIFNVVYDNATPTKHYSYTIDGASEWYQTVYNYATPANGLTLTKVADTTSDTYVVTFDDTKFSAPSFAAALSAALIANPTITGTGKDLTVGTGGKPTATGLDLGYYFVTSTNGALCNLTTTAPSVNIRDKNYMPFEKTDHDKVSANVGETVNYTITGKVPDHTGFDQYTYVITDKMSDGLTFDSASVKVKIGSTAVTSESGKYTLTMPTTGDDQFTFKLSIDVKKLTIGDDIEVTYNATVNKDAIAKIENNKATLTYTNGPTADKVGTITTPEEKVYTSKIVIDKVEKTTDGTAGKKLEGAEFVLYKRGTGTDTAPTDKDYDEVTEGNKTTYYPREYYQYTAATGNEGSKVGWDADKKQATPKTTDNGGAASFDGLANGTYYLLETKAPAGYNQMTTAKAVNVNGGDTQAQLIVTAKVENQAGTILPSTGGMGTTVFYVLGAVLVVGAGVLLVTKKRMSRSEG